MPAAVGISGNYLWRDGTVSTLAPPSAPLDTILRQPTQWAAPGAETGASNLRLIFETQPFIAAAIKLLAGQLARLPLKAYTAIAVEDGEHYERKRDRDSPVARAMVSPAPRRSAYQFKHDIAVGLLAYGNHVERIVRVRGGLYFLPLPWEYLTPTLSTGGDRVLGWTLRVPGEDEEVLTNLDVCHFTLGGLSGGLGLSPLSQLALSVAIDQAAQGYQMGMLRNGARLGVLLTVSDQAYRNAELRESIRQEFSERHAGPANAGKPYVATGVEATTMPQQTTLEADLMRQRLYTREEASAIYQVPTLFLGDLSKATLNNVGELHRQLYKTTLAPFSANIEGTIKAQVIDEHPGTGKRHGYVEFDANAILAGDPEQRAKTYADLEACGALTINEVRDRENLPRFDAYWADEPMLPTNNLTPASLAFQEPEAEPGVSPPPPDDGEE